MYKTNCNEEAIIKTIGKLSLEIPGLDDLQMQLKIKKVLEEVFYNYEVTTKETGLIVGDIDEKARIYLACKKLEGLSEKTLYNYELILGKLISFLRKPISTVTTMDLRMYLSLYGEGKRDTTVNAQISALKSFFSWLQDEEYIVKNPMKKIPLVKVPKRLRKALTDEEVELLRQACETPREFALIEFMVSSGTRLSEIVGVDIKDLNFSELSLNVIGKGDKERKVYFSTKAKILIKKYLESRTDTNPALFVTSKRPYGRLGGRSIERAIDKIALRAGLDISVFPHKFRHAFACHNLNSGMSLTALQELMGHEEPSTTQRYAVLSQEIIKHEYKRSN